MKCIMHNAAIYKQTIENHGGSKEGCKKWYKQSNTRKSQTSQLFLPMFLFFQLPYVAIYKETIAIYDALKDKKPSMQDTLARTVDLVKFTTRRCSMHSTLFVAHMKDNKLRVQETLHIESELQIVLFKVLFLALFLAKELFLALFWALLKVSLLFLALFFALYFALFLVILFCGPFYGTILGTINRKLLFFALYLALFLALLKGHY